MLTAQGDGLVDETRDDEWLDDAVAAMSVRKDGRVRPVDCNAHLAWQ